MKRAAGFLLVETLVALLVLSVGLLGASALLLRAVREEAGALRLLTANHLVADMAERIRVRGASHPEDLAEFEASARAHFPAQAPAVAVAYEPATGPATTATYRIALRWRDGDGPVVEISTWVLAQMPVAG
jgi:type IV pilus modification protein PilV